MGCGCNKNKFENQTNTPEQKPVEFKPITESGANQNNFSRAISMASSFAKAIASRGFMNNKVSRPVKQLRVLSCFGNKERGGELPPCEHLKASATPGKFFCGGCGCGDKPSTWLMAEGEEYSKLDYPKLNCPLNMPGFTNYEESKPDEANSPITRRYYLENINFNEVLTTPVSLPILNEQKPPVQ